MWKYCCTEGLISSLDDAGLFPSLYFSVILFNTSLTVLSSPVVGHSFSMIRVDLYAVSRSVLFFTYLDLQQKKYMILITRGLHRLFFWTKRPNGKCTGETVCCELTRKVYIYIYIYMGANMGYAVCAVHRGATPRGGAIVPKTSL